MKACRYLYVSKVITTVHAKGKQRTLTKPFSLCPIQENKIIGKSRMLMTCVELLYVSDEFRR